MTIDELAAIRQRAEMTSRGNPVGLANIVFEDIPALCDALEEERAQVAELQKRIRILESNLSKSVVKRLDAQGVPLDAVQGKTPEAPDA